MASSEQLISILNVQPGCATPLAFHTLGAASAEEDDAVILLLDSRFKVRSPLYAPNTMIIYIYIWYVRASGVQEHFGSPIDK